MEAPDTTFDRLISASEPLEATLVELIVAASECSEDEYEVADLVDAALRSGQVGLVPEPEPRPQPSWTAASEPGLKCHSPLADQGVKRPFETAV